MRYLPTNWPSRPVAAYDSATGFPENGLAAPVQQGELAPGYGEKKLPSSVGVRLMDFLRGKLSAADIEELQALLSEACGGDFSGGMDAAGYGRVYGTVWSKLRAADRDKFAKLLAQGVRARPVVAMDASARAAADEASFHEMYPEAARIKVDNFGVQPQPRRQPAMDAQAREDFFRRFPDARRIGFV